jgi:hypothetical protein
MTTISMRNTKHIRIGTRWLLAFLLAALSGWAQAQQAPDSLKHGYCSRQTQQFRIWIGADMAFGLGFRASSLSYTDATALVDASASARIGFFPINRLLLSLQADAFGSVASFDAWQSQELSARSFGGALRYYLRGGLFGEAHYGRGRGLETYRHASGLQEQAFRLQRYGLGMGIGNFWGEHFNFELLLRYQHGRGQFSDQRSLLLSGLSLTAGIGFSIGHGRASD